VEEIINTVSSGEITIVTIIIWTVFSIFVGALGGALGGMVVGGKHIGYEMAAWMGAFYGPVAAVPGAFMALTLLMLIQEFTNV